MTAPAGQTLCAKILGAKAGAPVVPGDLVDVTPDVTLSGGDTAAIARALEALQDCRVIDPEMHVVVLDRCTGAGGGGSPADDKVVRDFVEAQGIENFFDLDAGMAHQVAAEQGFALPGRLIVGSDPRAAACGAFGAYAVTIAPATMAAVMAGGRVRLPVPETVRLVAEGAWPAGVCAADLALRGVTDLAGEAAGRALELSGAAVTDLSVPCRMALCNLVAETGAVSSYIEPDAHTLAWLNGRARDNFELVRSDDDARFERTWVQDIGRLEPQVAGPRPGDPAVPVTRAAGVRVDEVVIGGGACGGLADLRAAAAILRGRRVAAGTRLLVLPASTAILKAAAGDGTLLALLEAGAILLNPGCATCMERQRREPAPGQTVLSADGSGHYRASPLTCAASALTGRIADPRVVAGEAVLREAAAAAGEV